MLKVRNMLARTDSWSALLSTKSMVVPRSSIEHRSEAIWSTSPRAEPISSVQSQWCARIDAALDIKAVLGATIHHLIPSLNVDCPEKNGMTSKTSGAARVVSPWLYQQFPDPKVYFGKMATAWSGCRVESCSSGPIKKDDRSPLATNLSTLSVSWVSGQCKRRRAWKARSSMPRARLKSLGRG